MAATTPFTFARFAVRLGFSAFLIYGTYNPSGTSFYHWATHPDGYLLSLKVLVGLLLAWAYLLLLPIIWAAMGPLGLGITVALVSTGTLAAWDYGLLDGVAPSFYPYGVIATLAVIMAIGLTWGHVNLQVWHLKLVRKIAPKV